MADAQLKDLTAAGPYTGFSDTDYIYAALNATSYDERRMSLGELVKYALGNAEIGGNDSGDIVTIDNTQTLSNKTIASPTLSGTVGGNASFSGTIGLAATTSIGTVTAAEIARLSGLSSNVQNQITALNAELSEIAKKPYVYGTTFTLGSGVTTKTFTENDIRTAVGLPSGYRVEPYSVSVSIGLMQGDGSYTVIYTATINISSTSYFGSTILDEIAISGLADQKSFNTVIMFNTILPSGA